MTEEDFQELIARYEATVASGRNAYFDADDMLDIIDWYMEEERDADADEAIRFATRLHPANTDFRLAEARLRLYQGDYEKAAEIINQLPSADDSPEACLLSGDILLHSANNCADPTFRDPLIEATQHTYEQALMLSDEDPSFYCSIINQHSRENLFDYANKWIDKAFERFPDNPLIMDAAALCYSLQNRPKDAIDMCNRLIDADPYNARSWGILGDIYHDFGDYTQALEAYDYVKAIRPDEKLSEQNMADCYFAQGHYTLAYRLYMSVVENYGTSSNLSPSTFDADYVRARLEICELHFNEEKKQNQR